MSDHNDIDYKRINSIQSITTAIQHLQGFLDSLKLYEDEKIIKVFIVTEKKHSIELIGHFSQDASKSLFELIRNSRNKIVLQLNKKLQEFVATGRTIKPIA